MKKVLFATTALVMTAGVAAAEVSVGGDGRMGVQVINGGDMEFEKPSPHQLSASGETDAGLSFGGSIRADNAGTTDVAVTTDPLDPTAFLSASSGGGVNGQAGSVFIEGTFGKISMGDVSGAPEAAVGDLSGVGLTGNGDFNELAYLSNGDRPAARWDYTTGDLGLHVSADNPGPDGDQAYGVAITYGMGDISFGLGHEDLDGVGHTVAGVTAGFGDATVKAVYGDANDVDFSQYGLSLDYVTGATTVTAFWLRSESGALENDAHGLGVSYDLGGGAAIKAGYADTDAQDDANYDFGISMSF